MINEGQKHEVCSDATEFKELMIGFKFRKYTWGQSVVPEIRLNGKWLDRLGFEMGKKVKVKFSNGKIELTI